MESELSIHTCADELAAFPDVGGAVADVLDAQSLELNPCPFAPWGYIFGSLLADSKLGAIGFCWSLFMCLLRCVALVDLCRHDFAVHGEPVGVGIFGF